MSEFSESFHLRADDTAAGVALLERAGLPGWVLPAEGGWVTVVVERDFTGEPEPALVAANDGVLLLYVNAEDHGWSLTAWDGTTEVSHYEAEWTDDIAADTSRLDVDALGARLGGVEGADVDALRTILADDLSGLDVQEVVRWVQIGNPGHRAAAAIGLTNVSWLSGDYLRNDDGRVEDAVRVAGR
jgi:hypothetical protein